MSHLSKSSIHIFGVLLILICVSVKAFGEGAMRLEDIRLTILYDNTTPAVDGVTAEWGFACLVEAGGHRLLFDTGGSGVVRENMRILGVDPADFEAVVLSHAHGDHFGGFPALMDEIAPDIPIYLPSTLAGKLPGILEKWGGDSRVIEEQVEIFPGVRLTRVLPASEPERALVLETEEECLVITGCAHPGLPRILDEVALMTGGKRPVLVMGGFHLRGMGRIEIDDVINEIVRQDVKYVLPTHCTGEKAIERFNEVFGPRCLKGGAGRVVEGETLIR